MKKNDMFKHIVAIRTAKNNSVIGGTGFFVKTEDEKTDPAEAEKEMQSVSEADGTEAVTSEKTDAENSETEVSDTTESGDEELPEEEDDSKVGFGSYLAFGPYIAIAVAAYCVLFDFVQYLAGLYLNLFK